MVEAFWELSLSRQQGFAVGPIPLSEIEVYCNMHEVEERLEFKHLIRAMDQVYLRYARDKQKRAAGGNST